VEITDRGKKYSGKIYWKNRWSKIKRSWKK